MDLALSPQDEAFREEVRGFLDQNLTEDLREAGRKTAGVFAEFEAEMTRFLEGARQLLMRRSWPKRAA